MGFAVFSERVIKRIAYSITQLRLTQPRRFHGIAGIFYMVAA